MTKRGRGQPTSYKPEYAAQAIKLCALGATDVELGDFFGVDRVTIWRWSNQNEDFCNALKTGKAALDERVAHSLYHRAVGYTFDSEKVFQHQGEIVRAKTKEHVPPDPTACIFWLKNRQPEQWRDRREIDVRRSPIDDLPAAELVELSQEIATERARRAGAGGAAPPTGKPH